MLITGSRSWTDEDAIVRVLESLWGDAVVVHGGAVGADQIAEEIALVFRLKTSVFKPDYERYGARAPLIRNIEMVDSGIDQVFAFWDGESRGTAFTIARAREKGIPVTEFRVRDESLLKRLDST